jgi:hypothetical protein
MLVAGQFFQGAAIHDSTDGALQRAGRAQGERVWMRQQRLKVERDTIAVDGVKPHYPGGCEGSNVELLSHASWGPSW